LEQLKLSVFGTLLLEISFSLKLELTSQLIALSWRLMIFRSLNAQMVRIKIKFFTNLQLEQMDKKEIHSFLKELTSLEVKQKL